MKDIQDKFLPYEETVLLNALGYNAPSFAYWSDWRTQEPFLISCEFGTERESCAIRRKNYLCSAILWTDAFDWIRNNHNLDGRILPWTVKVNVDGKLIDIIVWYFSAEKYGNSSRYKQDECKASNPIDANLACIRKLINTITQEKNVK